MNKLEGKVRSVRERRGKSARRPQSRLRTSSRSDDPTSPIPTWSSGSRPALRLPKSAGKPSTGRDHAAIPTIRLSVGRRPSELNQRAKCTPVRSIMSEVLGGRASLIGAHPSQSRNGGEGRGQSSRSCRVSRSRLDGVRRPDARSRRASEGRCVCVERRRAF